ncbi:MAG: shikimate dehydrogenase [Candidatus Acidiferrum sp.]|jgi:3-dehydroquinate dehydratase/shikimate dehydrogenase
MKPFGTGVGRICGVAAAATARELRVLLRQALRYTRTVELRLDWLRSDQERQKFLSWLKRSRPEGAILVATCRRRIGGGEFAGDAGAELYWLMKAGQAGCQWCDLEVETLRELPGKSVEGYAIPSKMMLSMHDFRRTAKLPKKLSLPPHGGVDAIKMAAMSQTIGDSVRLLKMLRHSRQLIAVPMGEIGLPARLLALREGSALAYAPVAAVTAPGQVHLRDFKEMYRAHKITLKTRVFGVIGNPIGHSMSPLLHNTGYIAAKKDAVFLPFLVERLDDFLKAAPDLGVEGFGVTLPHKEAVFRRLDDCEPLAQRIGAVNTVTVRRDGSLYGSNTDYLGVLRALERKLQLRGSRVLIFGAGGSARAAAFALAHAGAEVFVCARREAAAKALARAVGGEAVRRGTLGKERFDAILNATPVGMHPQVGISPLRAGELHCPVVMDFIYRPLRTKLLQIAAAKGIRTVSGVEMFLAQGIAQWELWMGGRAPEAAMRRAVLQALQAGKQKRG